MPAVATLLVNCHVVDVRDGSVTRDAAVLIEDGVIRDVGPRAAVEANAAHGNDAAASDDAVASDDLSGSVELSTSDDLSAFERLDLGGRYLLPGLINMHTHFSLSLPGPRGDDVQNKGPHALALYMADGARRTLHEGVTTVRCVAEKDGADFALRDAIADGYAVGPRILTAGRALVCTGGHGHEGSDTLECDGPTGFRRGVRSQVKLGADLIKVMISGGIAGQHEKISTPQLAPDELAAVLETAHAWGRKVTAHAGPAPIIQQAVDLGLDCVEHGYQLTPDVAASMAAQGTALVPTLVVTRCGSFFDELGIPPWMQQRSLDAGPEHRRSYELALAAGVQMLLGSDMPPFWPFEGTSATVREMEHMSDFGLGPTATLRAATLDPAAWLGIDDLVGTIEPGKRADLIALPDDPTASVSALRSLDFVMQSGTIRRDTRPAAAPATEDADV